MNLLLDTHALLWWAADAPLSPDARTAIADPVNVVHVSAVSIWEISIKTGIGKLSVDGDLDGLVKRDFEALDITLADGRRAGELPLHHRDPFDRMLIAQAIGRGLTLVSRDARFADYDVQMLVA